MKQWPGSGDSPGMLTAVASDGGGVGSGFVPQMVGYQRRALIGVWAIIGLLVVGVASFSWMQLQSAQAKNEEVIQNTLFNLTRVNAEHALRTLRAADQTLLFVMSQYKEQQDRLDLAAMVASGVIDDSLFASVAIIDTKGILAPGSIPFVKGLDLSDRLHFKVHQAADTQDLYVSKVVLGRASGKRSMQLSRRINKPDGSFAGVAVVSVRIDYFTKFYDELRLPEKSSAMLVGLDGEVRARQSDDHSSAGQDISSGPMLKLIASGQVAGSYVVQSLIDGVERVHFFRAVSGYPLVVNIGFSKEVVAALQRRSQAAIFLQAAALCLLLLVVGVLASFYLVRMQKELDKRQRMAAELRASETRLGLALAGGELCVWEWDFAHARFTSNEQISRLLGYQQNELVLGRASLVSLIAPEDIDPFFNALLLHLHGKSEGFKNESRFRHKDGRWIWISITSRVIAWDDQGRASVLAGTAQDVTLQRTALDQVQDQNERLNAIFSLSPDALVCFDQGYRVTYANPAFERLTGLTVTSVLGLGKDEFTQKINSQCAPTCLFGGLDALGQLPGAPEGVNRVTIELVAPSRRVLRAKLQHSGSTSASHILYLRDVTHETIVDEMKSEFLSTAAHELRTPMASILGFSEVLLTHQLDAAQNKEFLGIILTQSQHMSVILDELLDLARIETRQDKDFVFEALNLPVLVNEVVVGFSLPVGRSAPVVVLPDVNLIADRGKAGQAILNVLSNAYKYSPPGATVSIHFVESQHQDKGLLCGICVQDQGCGMTGEQLGRVFERFYRADTTGTTPGTGLGMSIVKEIMEIHGGDILIDSVFGVGTSVTLLFPCTHPQDLPGPEAMTQTLHSPA